MVPRHDPLSILAAGQHLPTIGVVVEIGLQDSFRRSPAPRSATGTNNSTRRSKFRGIQSALLINSFSSPPWWKQKIRACSRNRSTMEITSMLSLSPLTPGRRQHWPRTFKRILTPARLARYSASITSGSTKAFEFRGDLARGRPAGSAGFRLRSDPRTRRRMAVGAAANSSMPRADWHR